MPEHEVRMLRRDVLKTAVGLGLGAWTGRVSTAGLWVEPGLGQTSGGATPRLDEAFSYAFPLYEFVRTEQDRWVREIHSW